MRENKTYYKKKIYLVVFTVTLIFGLQGLYEYYKVKIDDPLQLLSAVLYGKAIFIRISDIGGRQDFYFL